MRIGAFSKYVKTTVKTLRYYDRIGLFGPAYTDPVSGYRYYTEEQLSDFERIRRYRAAGLSVVQIKRLLEGEDPEAVLLEQQELLNRQERLLRGQKRAVAMLLNAPAVNDYAVTVKELPGYIACTCRTRVPDAARIPPAFSERFRRMKEEYPGFALAKPNYCCVTFTDAGHRETDIEVEYAEAVTAPQENKNGFVFKTLAGGSFACVEHRGAYETVAGAYAALFKWIGSRGYQTAGTVRERFIHGAWDRTKESDWLVEVQVPVRRSERPL